MEHEGVWVCGGREQECGGEEGEGDAGEGEPVTGEGNMQGVGLKAKGAGKTGRI